MIAFDAALVDATFGSASSATAAFTVTGTDPALVVGVMVDDPQTVTGVTYHGAAMTPVDSQATGVGATLFVFALLAPAVGTHDIVASYSAPTTSRIAAGSWTGVTALDTSGKNSSGGANATSLAVTVTPMLDQTWTVGLLMSAAGTGTAGAATTQRGTTPSALGVFDSGATQTPAAAVTLTLSSSSNKLSGIAIALSGAAPSALTATAVWLPSDRVTGGGTLTVAGTGFVDGATDVTLDGIACTPTVLSASRLEVVAPAHAAGPVDLVVTVGAASATLPFRYYALAETPTSCQVSLDGVLARVVRGSVSVHGSLTHQQAQFLTMDGAPTLFSAVRIGVGSLADADLLFAGQVQTTSLLPRPRAGGQVLFCWTVDCTGPLTRWRARLVTAAFTATPGAEVAAALLAAYAPDYTGVHVEAGLPDVTLAWDGVDLATAWQDLATACLGHQYVDAAFDAHLFQAESLLAPEPLVPGNRTLQVAQPPTVVMSAAQYRNRVSVTGAKTAALAAVGAGATSLPLVDASLFDPAGGLCRVGVQRPAYTSLALGGTSSQLAGVPQAPSAPSAAHVSATGGQIAGDVQYAITAVLPGGESECSARTSTISSGPMGGPVSSTPTFTPSAGGRLPNGTVAYSFAAVDALGGVGSRSAGSAYVVTTGGTGQQMTITGLPSSASDARAVGLVVYRSKVGGNESVTHYEAGRITITSGTFVDQLADEELGVEAAVTSGHQTDVTVPSVTAAATSCRLYRTRINDASGSLYRLGAVAGHAGGTFRDNAPNDSLGDLAPDESHVGTPAGATTIPVVEVSAFPAAGWLLVGARYTGRSASSGDGTLTGVPASGEGALARALQYGDTVMAAPFLEGVTGLTDPVLPGEAVALFVRRDAAASQAAVAALEGGGSTGIYDVPLRDETLLTAAAAAAAGDAQLAVWLDGVLASVSYTTLDRASVVGRVVSMDWPALGLPAADLLLQDVAISRVDVLPGVPPLYTVVASAARYTYDDYLRRGVV